MRLWTRGFHDLPGARRAVWEARCMLGESGVERVLVVCVADRFFGKRWTFARNPELRRLDIYTACFANTESSGTESLAPGGHCPRGEALKKGEQTERKSS
ncbi:hypothetical protein [Thermosulfurimonas sp. F29]|uniref:hypothetical protein n=1 Tax=Thermosulfurimonas sp. F29 TaxID=2867247 RepID=UPI001C837F7D|nr:hypothetical protein [Thermosulfurimonas sp. F29]MBX6424131.1 hypothetical protein [Thermosulfurimonas sp. F29]